MDKNQFEILLITVIIAKWNETIESYRDGKSKNEVSVFNFFVK